VISLGSEHEPHYDLASSAIMGRSATLLALIVTLGNLNPIISKNGMLRIMMFTDFIIIEATLVLSIFSLSRRAIESKRTLTILCGLLLIFSTIILVSIGYESLLTSID
jgi:hypothetical protein